MSLLIVMVLLSSLLLLFIITMIIIITIIIIIVIVIITIIIYQGLIDEIDSGNFRIDNINTSRKIANTDDIISDCKSSVTSDNHIKLSLFHKSQVAGTDDKMTLVKFTANIIDIVRERCGNYDIENIIEEEVIIVEKIRGCLWWLHESGYTISEITTQKIFVIYCNGLLSRLGIAETRSMFNINGIYLLGDIRVKINTSSDVEVKELRGHADVAFATREDFSDKELQSSSIIIGELKRCFGALSMNKSSIGNATSQVLGELFCLAQMRHLGHGGELHSLDSSESLMVSFLTDMMSIRLVFRLVINGVVYYPITSLEFDSTSFAAFLIFLALGISVEENIADYIDILSPVAEVDSVEDEDEGHDQDYRIDELDALVTSASRNTSPIQSKTTGRDTRLPLGEVSNILLLCDDDNDCREQAREIHLRELRSLAKWEAARLGYSFLSADNLAKLDRVEAPFSKC